MTYSMFIGPTNIGSMKTGGQVPGKQRLTLDGSIDPTRMPKPVTPAMILNPEPGPFHSPTDAVKGLGLPPGLSGSLASVIRREANSTKSELVFRRAVATHLVEQFPNNADIRRAALRNAASYFRGRMSKSSSAGESSSTSFKPPAGVQSAARRGLELRRKYNRGGIDHKEAKKQGIGSGVQRASNLANGHSVSLATVKRMHAFFSRHQKNKTGVEPDGGPSAGKIAWLLWGGDAGRRWAAGIVNRMAKSHEDKMPGGLADRCEPGDFDPQQLTIGIDVEYEHTNDPAIAQEIAMDHLTEDPKYYDKLREMEAQKAKKDHPVLAIHRRQQTGGRKDPVQALQDPKRAAPPGTVHIIYSKEHKGYVRTVKRDDGTWQVMGKVGHSLDDKKKKDAKKSMALTISIRSGQSAGPSLILRPRQAKEGTS